MPEVSIKDQLKKLIDLQKIDKEVFDFKKELEDKPSLLEELKVAFEAKKEALKEQEEKLKQLQVDRKSKELELQSKEEEITKANTVLSQIKTNKEYTAKISEIENLKADKSIIEEKILQSYDEADNINGEIEKEKKILSDEEQKYTAQKKEIEDSLKILQDKVKVLESQRKQITPDIDSTTLGLYEKILSKKEGLAIVPVQGSSCGGCFMNVPAQVVNEVKMHKDIVRCEMCTRILYTEEDL